MELDPALPNLPQEILEHLDGELLAWAAAIAEAEGCEAGVVADGQRFAVNDTESRAEAAVVDGGLAAVSARRGRAFQRAKASSLMSRLVGLSCAIEVRISHVGSKQALARQRMPRSIASSAKAEMLRRSADGLRDILCASLSAHVLIRGRFRVGCRW